jgi:hypothetical protein
MPYPESCPECGGAFRNTGTHYTARRNEVGRHVLLELGCQNTSRRYWWDFTSGTAAEDSTTPGRRASMTAANGSTTHQSNGHAGLVMLERPADPVVNAEHLEREPDIETSSSIEIGEPQLVADVPPQPKTPPVAQPQPQILSQPPLVELAGPPPTAPAALREAFIRQLQLDRLTLRQMRSWLMAEDARRAMEVAAGATEATYERLALILFGVDLPQLLGKQSAPPPAPGMSAEERLELQREKARIRARLRRAAARTARQPTS